MARFFHSVDQKGRVIVPVRVRNNLDGVLYVTPSLDEGYLSAYSSEQFQSILDQLNQQSGTDPEFRQFRRDFLGIAQACELDSQGRIGLSTDLMELIGISPGDEICFIDMFGKVEICSKRFFDQEEAGKNTLSQMDLRRFDVKGL